MMASCRDPLYTDKPDQKGGVMKGLHRFPRCLLAVLLAGLAQAQAQAQINDTG